jgi:peptide/nickel transport system substrate-binding protein
MPTRTRIAASLALVLAAVAGLFAAGCGGGGVAGSTFRDTHPLPQDTMTVAVPEIGRYGGRFVLAQTIGPKTFNPLMANETSSTDVDDGRLFIGLVDYDNGAQRDIPAIAKSWETSPDGLTWTFHLRRGACFSDGHPITSADVLFNFELAYDDTLHPSVQDLLKVQGKKFELSAPDSYTVVMKLAAPYALLTAAVGSLYIMPKHVLEPAYRAGRFASAYNTSTPPESLVTSGAWTLKQYVPGEKTVLTRNPYFYRVDPAGHRLPYLDELVFLIVPDQNTAALKFQAGEVDGIDNVKPEDYKAYAENQKKLDYTLYDLGPALRTNFLWFNLNTVKDAKKFKKKLGAPQVDPVKYAWFKNPAFRKSVSMAIDRDAIIRSVYFGDGVKNWSTTTAGNKVWHSDAIRGDDYDPEQAKKLLDGLGYTDRNGDGVREDPAGHPLRFTLKTNGDNNVRMGMANFVKDDLAKIGIDCQPTGMDFNALITNLRENFDYDAALLGLQSGVPPDPGQGQNVYRSSGITHYWNIKQVKPESPEEARIDGLMTENVGTNDMAVRQKTWAEIQTLVNQQDYFIWLPTQILKVPIRNHFGNLHPVVIPHTIIWNIDQVFMKSPGRPA